MSSLAVHCRAHVVPRFLHHCRQETDERVHAPPRRPPRLALVHPAAVKGVRVFQVDTNFWKSFLQARWRTAAGDPGAVARFGDAPLTHYMPAEHLDGGNPRACHPANGCSVEEWRSRPGTSANHWLDGLVMNAAAASLCGVTFPGCTDARPAPKTKLRLRDLQKRR